MSSRCIPTRFPSKQKRWSRSSLASWARRRISSSTSHKSVNVTSPAKNIWSTSSPTRKRTASWNVWLVRDSCFRLLRFNKFIAEFILSVCGCVKFSMPHTKGTQVCGQRHADCIKAVGQMTILSVSKINVLLSFKLCGFRRLPQEWIQVRRISSGQRSSTTRTI